MFIGGNITYFHLWYNSQTSYVILILIIRVQQWLVYPRDHMRSQSEMTSLCIYIYSSRTVSHADQELFTHPECPILPSFYRARFVSFLLCVTRLVLFMNFHCGIFSLWYWACSLLFCICITTYAYSPELRWSTRMTTTSLFHAISSVKCSNITKSNYARS